MNCGACGKRYSECKCSSFEQNSTDDEPTRIGDPGAIFRVRAALAKAQAENYPRDGAAYGVGVATATTAYGCVWNLIWHELEACEEYERSLEQRGVSSALRSMPYRVLATPASETPHVFTFPVPTHVVSLWAHDHGNLNAIRVAFPMRDARGEPAPSSLPATWLDPRREHVAQFAHLIRCDLPADEPLEVTFTNDDLVPVYVAGTLLYRAELPP